MSIIENARIIPLPPVDWGGGDIRDVVLLEITSTEGITGLGSAYSGVDQLRDALAHYQQDSATLHEASAEMTIPMSAIDKILRSILDQGFRAVKLCIENFGHRGTGKSDREWDILEAALLGFARKIVGNNVQLMLDVYGSAPEWTGDFDWALNTAKVLEELDYRWFEEPLAPEAFEDFVRLTQMANVAIAGGEDFILVRDFEALSNLKAVSILQPDCTRVGGLTQMQFIRNAASQNNLQLIPHGWNTAIGLAADLQFQATMSDDKYCMVEYRPHRIITNLLKHNPFSLDNEGKITVPAGSGLGVELNDEFRNQTSGVRPSHGKN